jgi:hypothetical protein
LELFGALIAFHSANNRLAVIPLYIHTHKNLVTVKAHRTSNPAAKHQTTEFLTANEQ